MSGFTTVDLRHVGRWRARRLLRRLYRDVLVPSFDPAELRPWSDLRHDVLSRDGTSVARVALDERGTVVGGGIADWDPELRVVLGAHLAVRPDMRNEGVGSTIFALVYADVIGQLDPLLGLGEVEDPRLHPAADGRDPEARLRLYDRLGVQLLPIPYIAPKVRPEMERLPGFLLTIGYLHPDLGTDAVPSELLAEYLRRYFVLCEGEEVLDRDPEVAALFEHLAGVREIPIVPLRDYASAIPGR